MRIFELERIPDYKSERDWEAFTPHWINDSYRSVGSYKGLDFRVYENQGMIRIVGFNGNLIQAYLTLMQQSHGYHVQAVQVASTYRGQGIALHMYKIAIVNMHLTVVSDYQQTRGGSAIWSRLQREPDVQVDSIDGVNSDPYASSQTRLRAIAA